MNHVFTCVRCNRQWTVVSSEELECFFCGLCYWCILETKVTQVQIQSALSDLLKQNELLQST